jgi:hypothetical protein
VQNAQAARDAKVVLQGRQLTTCTTTATPWPLRGSQSAVASYALTDRPISDCAITLGVKAVAGEAYAGVRLEGEYSGLHARVIVEDRRGFVDGRVEHAHPADRRAIGHREHHCQHADIAQPELRRPCSQITASEPEVPNCGPAFKMATL